MSLEEQVCMMIELLMIVNVVTMNMMKLHRLILIVNRVAMLDDLNTYVFYIKSVAVAKTMMMMLTMMMIKY